MLLNVFFFITILFSVGAVQLAKRKFGLWLNHYTLTNFFWLISLTVSIYYNSYKQPVNDDIYFIFFIGLLAYNSTILYNRIPLFNGVAIDNLFSLKKRRLLELIVILGILPSAITNLLLIMSGVELWRLNYDYWQEGRQSGSYLQLLFIQNIVEPLSIIVMSTCYFTFYRYTSKNKNILTISIAFLVSVLYVLMTGGGRTSIAIFGYFTILSFFISRDYYASKYFFRITPKVVFSFAALALIIIGWASAGRGSSESLRDVLSNRLAFFAPIFEWYFYNSPIFSEYTLGHSMFETVVALFEYPLKLLGLSSDYIRTGEYVQQFVYVPKLDDEINAGVSAYFYYMRDFGIMGAFIGPIIVAFIYNVLYRFCLKSPFLTAYYFVGVLCTCLGTGYPFGRGFVFQLIFAFLIDKYCRTKDYLRNDYIYNNTRL